MHNPFEIILYQEVDSTNSVALKLGNQGAEHGTVVQARSQTGGRGRLSREFISPPGGLYVSVILRPLLVGDELPLVTLAAGVAVAQSIEKISNLPVRLKWPNDLYTNGKKLGGILTEAGPYSHATDSIPFIVTGIGVNVNTTAEAFPVPLRNMVTSLYCQSSHKYNIDQLLQLLVNQLVQEIDNLRTDKENVFARWRSRDYMLKKQLCWQNPQGKKIIGFGAGLLPDGRYRLITADGDDFPVLSGEIVVTEINGQQIK